MEKKEICTVGIDLSDHFSSVSYMETGEVRPVSMSVSADDGKYVIPMNLYRRKLTNEWLIGDEAAFAAGHEKDGKDFFADSVFAIYRKNQIKYLGEQEYDGAGLFREYLFALYQKAKELLGFSEDVHLVFTAETMDFGLVSFLGETFLKLGFPKEQLHFMNHTEAFVSYVLCEKKELRANDVTLFSLDEHQFVCKNMTRRRMKNKSIIFVEEQDLSGLVQYAALKTEAQRQEADEKFSSYLREDYRTHIVSSVYFTGIGFYENWYPKSIAEICRKRRAFKGFNLYAEGAAAGRTKRPEQIDLYCEGRTLVSVSILRLVKGTEEEFLLSPYGVNWTEAGAEAEFILNETEKLELVLENPFQKEKEILEIDLKEIKPRTDKTMCIDVQILFESPQVFDVIVEDRGFGDFIKSSGRRITKRISLEG
jgi:hypothetical protein